MTVKELKQILEQFNENLQVGVAIQAECVDCGADIETHIDTLYFDSIFYNPIENKVFISRDGECN